MRIVHVIPTYLPATRYGGPIYAVHALCRALAERGHEVEVVTTNVDGDGASDVPTGRVVMLEGVAVRYFPVSGVSIPAALARRLYVSPAMNEYLRHGLVGADVVHLHSVFLWPTRAAARGALRAGVPYLVAPRGMLVPELIRRKSRLFKTAWMQLVERKTLSHAAGVHFTSQREWEDAARTGLPLPAPFVVPNGIDVPPWRDDPRIDHLLLYLGRLSWKKGLDRLIDALPLVPGARLVIAGNDEENLTPALRTRAARLGADSRIEFRGPVYGPEKEKLLRSVAALVLPSYSENFGNVVVEAMAVATPVIVTQEVGLADAVASSGAGLVVSNEPSALAGAIASLMRDPAQARAMGERGRNAVEAHFRWGGVAEEMEKHYERITASTPRTKASS